MKALLEIIEYLERRDRLDAATKRQLAAYGVPLDVLYAASSDTETEGLLDAVGQAAARDEVAAEEAEEAALEALAEKAGRSVGKAGKAGGKSRGAPKPKDALLADLDDALAARRMGESAALAAFRDLAAMLGAGAEAAADEDVDADRAALRAVIEATPDALTAALAKRLDAGGAAALRALCAAALIDYHLPLAGDDSERAPLPAGPALRSYRMLLEVLDPSAAGLAWVLRADEVAFAFDLARAQRLLVASMAAALRASPHRFAAPIKPFAPGPYGLLCGLLTAQSEDAEASAASRPGLRTLLPRRELLTDRAFVRGFAVGFGAERGAAPTLEADARRIEALPEDHPMARLAALQTARRVCAELPAQERARPYARRARGQQLRGFAREQAAAAKAANEAASRAAGRLRALEDWALAAPRETG